MRTASFAAHMLSGALLSSTPTTSPTTWSKSSSSQVSATNPAACASSPEIIRARSSRSSARAGPRWCTSSEYVFIDRQLPSVRAIGTPNVAVRVATRRSQTAASASPPPTQ